MSDRTPSKGGSASTGQLISLAATFGYIAIFVGVRSAPSVDFFGISLPVWAIALASFALGAVAMWGESKRQRNR